MSYELLVRQRQYWRAVSAAFSHANAMHLLFNMASLWACGQMEVALGSAAYVHITLLLLLLSTSLSMAAYYVLSKRFGMRQMEAQTAVGYSCVVFGWMTIMAQLRPGGVSLPLPGGLSLPLNLAPFTSLLVTQLIVRRASFIGHLSGIFAGFFIAWGMMGWLTPYWLYSTVLLHVTLPVLASLRQTAGVRVPCITVPERRDAAAAEGAPAAGGAGGPEYVAPRAAPYCDSLTRLCPCGSPGDMV